MFKVFNKIKNLIGGLGILHVLIYAFSIIQAVITVYFAITVKDVINSATNFTSANDLIFKCVVCVSIVVISYLLSVVVKLISEKLKVQTEINLKRLVFSGYVNNEYSTLSKVKSGKLLSVLNNDTVLLASGYVTLLPAIFSTLVKLITTVIVLYLLQPIFTLIILLVGVAVIFITFFVRKISAKLYKNTLKMDSKSLSFVNDNIDNALIVKSYRGEKVVIDINDQNLQGYEKAKKKQKYFNQIISDATGLMFMGFYVVTLIWCAFGIFNKIQGVDFGVMTAMLQLVMQIRAPFAFLGNAVTSYYEMKVSYERIQTLLSKNDKIEYKKIDNFDEIVLKDVNFSYNDEQKVVKDLSLTVKKGQKILIKGQSGIGKTTLLKIITGVYPISQGKAVVIFGDSQIDLYNSYNLFSTVFQGNMLFSGTIKENICFFRKYDKEDYEKAIENACLKELINSLPDGDMTYIGEKGASLSEGQRQRIAIARALFTGYKILVLDEVTSSLDAQTETQILSNIFNNYNLTIIAVSHKNATASYCDAVYEYSDGVLNKVN